MSLTKTTHLGLKSEIINEFDNKRPVIPEEDIYPPMLMTRSPSVKVKGIARLWYASIYQNTQRIRELIMKYYTKDGTDINIFGEVCYGNTIMNQVCSGNIGGNIMYEHNRNGYHNILFTLLTSIKCDHIVKLLNIRNDRPWGGKHSPIGGLVGNIEYRKSIGVFMYHYIPVLINYGLKLEDNEIDDIEYDGLIIFLKSHLAKKIMSSDKPAGHKYEEILAETVCPITLEKIGEVAITTDGHVFEKKAIIEYLKKIENKINPVTKIEFPEKIIYLPYENRFKFIKHKKTVMVQIFGYVKINGEFVTSYFGNKHTFTFYTYLENTVREFIKIINDKVFKEDNRPPFISIKYRETILDNMNKTLLEYNIKKEATIDIEV